MKDAAHITCLASAIFLGRKSCFARSLKAPKPMDFGCSTTLASKQDDLITCESDSGVVKGLGVYQSIGTGTVKYTVLDDNDVKKDIIIKTAIHMPIMHIRQNPFSNWYSTMKTH